MKWRHHSQLSPLEPLGHLQGGVETALSTPIYRLLFCLVFEECTYLDITAWNYNISTQRQASALCTRVREHWKRELLALSRPYMRGNIAESSMSCAGRLRHRLCPSARSRRKGAPHQCWLKLSLEEENRLYPFRKGPWCDSCSWWAEAAVKPPGRTEPSWVLCCGAWFCSCSSWA